MPRPRVSSEGKGPTASQGESGATTADPMSELLTMTTILWDFRVEYPGTWLQRLSPADFSTTELARRCSCGMDTLVGDVECALAANKDL